MINIRPVQQSDWPFLADVAEEAHLSTPILGPFIKSVWEASWRTFSENEISVTYVLEIDGIPRGAISGVVTANPAHGELVAAMSFWHIARDFRGSGIKLLRKWIARVRELGAVRLTMNHLLDLDSIRLGQFYRRMGMEPLEKHYIMDL